MLPLGRIERVSDQGEQRILLGLRAGVPDGQVTAASLAQESLRDISAAEDAEAAVLLLDKTVAACAQGLVPEIRRVGRTLRAWRSEILAHHLTHGHSPLAAITQEYRRLTSSDAHDELSLIHI